MAITENLNKQQNEALPKYKQFIRSVGANDIALASGGMIFSAQSVDKALQGWYELGYKVHTAAMTFARTEGDTPEHYNIYYLLELQE